MALQSTSLRNSPFNRRSQAPSGRWPLAALAATLLVGSQAQAAGECSSYDAGHQTGAIGDTVIDESSGLAASTLNAGVFWTHNDSGNLAEVFAMRLDGSILASYSVPGVVPVDWEDMAIGPCPTACACLFIADIGDNLEARPTKTIYRVAEPNLDEGGTQTEAPLEMSFQYPDGRHNAETVLVDPRSGDIYIVAKNESGIDGVYKFPTPDPSSYPVTLEKVATLTFTGGSVLTTGGSVAADADRLIIRTYDRAMEYTIPAGQPLEAAFASPGRPVALPSQSGGEAVSYSTDGMALVLTSEGVSSPIQELNCTSGTPITAPAAALGDQCATSTGGCGARVDPHFKLGWGLVLGGGLWMRRRRR